jgi:hypothetical protein
MITFVRAGDWNLVQRPGSELAQLTHKQRSYLPPT